MRHQLAKSVLAVTVTAAALAGCGGGGSDSAAPAPTTATFGLQISDAPIDDIKAPADFATGGAARPFVMRAGSVEHSRALKFSTNQPGIAVIRVRAFDVTQLTACHVARTWTLNLDHISAIKT